MKILELCMSVLAPDYCLGCGAVGTWLCMECQPQQLYPEMCHVCKRPAPGSLTCQKCAKSTKLSALYVFSSLEKLSKGLVWTAKYLPSRSGAAQMGRLAVSALPYFDLQETVIVHVPTAPNRIRQRAFDQSLEMTKVLAKATGLTRLPALKRLTFHHQVGSTRKERVEHMKDAFGCRKSAMLRGKTVLIVDDVYTTGATLESAARVLKAAGAKRVVGVVFARAE